MANIPSVLAMSQQERDEAFSSISNTIVHEIGHILAYQRCNINPTFIGFDRRGLAGVTSFVSRTVPEDLVELGSAGGVLFENAVFGRCKIEKSQMDLISIVKNEREKRPRRNWVYPDITDVDSGARVVKILINRHSDDFPNNAEIQIGLRMHDSIYTLINSSKIIRNHVIVYGFRLFKYVKWPQDFHEILLHWNMALGRLDQSIAEALDLAERSFNELA